MGRHKREDGALFHSLVRQADEHAKVQILTMAIERCGGNLSKTAAWLEITPQYINMLVKQLGMRDSVRALRAAAKANKASGADEPDPVAED